MSDLEPTPSQTIGPFFGFALPFPGGETIAPPGHPDTITIHGDVYDGKGETISDALIEIWQAAPDGSTTGAPGSLRSDVPSGRAMGRDGVNFTGFGRVSVDRAGHYVLHTLPPGHAARASRPGAVGVSAPYLSVCFFARGLLLHLYTRIYLPDNAEANAADPVLAALEPARRATLVATRERERVYRFDIRVQGEGETVFLEFS
jgi:protocatechuate 3,4-dioxygenase alpha subunit